jgi:YHS domain-containing protein
MIRTVLYLLISIFLITFLRYVIGIIGKAFSNLARPSGPASAGPSPHRTETAGELKKDPVCGTYVAAATSVKKTVRGEVIHFCSEACRDKYKAE